MTSDSKKGFPAIPVKHWWTLRERFRKSIPSKADTNYLASVLGMTQTSAKNNILSSLRSMGIVDVDGKPTDRAVRWRDDAQYPAVCNEIRKSVYPKELLDVADGTEDREAASRWFANHSGGGESLVNKVTTVYMLLCEADPARAAAATLDGGAKKSIISAGSHATRMGARKAAQSPKGKDQVRPRDPTEVPGGPAFHLNVQIHISPDSSADQIEQIFASMGKHLKQLTT